MIVLKSPKGWRCRCWSMRTIPSMSHSSRAG
jgi:hypothetical protein